MSVLKKAPPEEIEFKKVPVTVPTNDASKREDILPAQEILVGFGREYN